MAALSDRELERFCQARAVGGSPASYTAGRRYHDALSYAIGILGGGGGATRKHMVEGKIGLNRGSVAARIAELGGAPDSLFGGV